MLNFLHEIIKPLNENTDHMSFAICHLADLYIKHKFVVENAKINEKCSSMFSARELQVQAIKEYPIPRGANEVRRFLGFARFFRKFVQDFAMIAQLLVKLTKKLSFLRQRAENCF